jgi:hypothetical protein
MLGTATFDMRLELARLVPSKIGRVPVSDVVHRDGARQESAEMDMGTGTKRQVSAGQKCIFANM